MDNVRLFYRNTVGEVILTLAVLTQIISGLKLFFKKRKTGTAFFNRLQIWTGLYLAIFLVIHISAVFVGGFTYNLKQTFTLELQDLIRSH